MVIFKVLCFYCSNALSSNSLFTIRFTVLQNKQLDDQQRRLSKLRTELEELESDSQPNASAASKDYRREKSEFLRHEVNKSRFCQAQNVIYLAP